MAARVTDKQKKKIIADYLELGSYNATAKINGVANHTVKRIIQACPTIAENVQQKKDQNTADILAYMESKRSVICEIIDNGLEALRDPKKLARSSPVQITTALGTLIDKWTMISGGPEDVVKEDGLSKSLRELAEGLESDD